MPLDMKHHFNNLDLEYFPRKFPVMAAVDPSFGIRLIAYFLLFIIASIFVNNGLHHSKTERSVRQHFKMDLTIKERKSFIELPTVPNSVANSLNDEDFVHKFNEVEEEFRAWLDDLAVYDAIDEEGATQEPESDGKQQMWFKELDQALNPDANYDTYYYDEDDSSK